MKYYSHIDSIFKRDTKGNFMVGDYSTPAIEFLKDNLWLFTEKVDGTNTCVEWDGAKLSFGGHTARASLPPSLVTRLHELFSSEKMASVFPDLSLTLYGEGYGEKIQKVGKLYLPEGVDFILFDVSVGELMLERPNIEDVARKLGIRCVPIVGHGTLADAITMTREGYISTFGAFPAEGLVLRPLVDLKDRQGNRIITKVKTKDWKGIKGGVA